MSNNQQIEEGNGKLDLSYDTTISLLNVYFSEWSHRDNILWSQTFKLYYAVLIVILLPNISGLFDIKLPPLHIVVYRLVGLGMSVVFLYISLGYAVRLQSIGDTYQEIITGLPEKYRRKGVSEIELLGLPVGKWFQKRLGYTICITLFISLFSLALLFLAFDIKLL